MYAKSSNVHNKEQSASLYFSISMNKNDQTKNSLETVNNQQHLPKAKILENITLQHQKYNKEGAEVIRTVPKQAQCRPLEHCPLSLAGF